MANENQENLEKVLREAGRDKFWGDVTITYRDGRPTLVRKTQTIPLDGRTAHARKNISS